MEIKENNRIKMDRVWNIVLAWFYAIFLFIKYIWANLLDE